MNVLGQPVIQVDLKFQVPDSYFTTVTVPFASAMGAQYFRFMRFITNKVPRKKV